RLEAGDLLLVRGHRDSLEMLRGLQQLTIESEMVRELSEMESDDIGLTEAMIAPRSSLAGMTLRDVDFRGRYGLQVMAILQGGRTYRSNLRDRVLQFGDALLLLGKLDRRAHLARDADFILLTQEDQDAPRRGLAPVATLIMTVALGTVLLGWLPISIAAVAGATLMILVGCLTMTEAYAAVEWRAIFLISGMLPLGAALQNTGAASFLAEGVLSAAGPFGVWGVLVSLYLLTAVATCIIPTAALVVLMAPIAMRACADIGLSPHAAMMAVAMAASASFTSPISHPANILVMAPGGYRFVDYVKLGLPLTLVVMLVALFVLPFFWPL
ncbi:MAG: SLC13 family permease, partial [Planctomycetota bacterium]